jgi:hypothetical protein
MTIWFGSAREAAGFGEDRMYKALLLIVLIIHSFPARAQQEAPWIGVMLPFDTVLELPGNWIVASANPRIPVEAAPRLSDGALADFQTLQAFTAHALDGNRRPIGLFLVRFVEEKDVTLLELPLIMMVLSGTPIADPKIDELLKEQVIAGLSRENAQLVSWSGASAMETNGLRFLVLEYRRTTPTGIILVRTLLFFSAEGSFRVLVSYRDEHADLLKATMDRVVRSIKRTPTTRP